MPGAATIPRGNVSVTMMLSLTLSPALIAANTSAEQTFTLPGAKVGDMVFVQKPTAQAGLIFMGTRASAKDTVGILFANFTGSNITPTAAEVYTFLLVRFENYPLGAAPGATG